MTTFAIIPVKYGLGSHLVVPILYIYKVATAPEDNTAPGVTIRLGHSMTGASCREVLLTMNGTIRTSEIDDRTYWVGIRVSRVYVSSADELTKGVYKLYEDIPSQALPELRNRQEVNRSEGLLYLFNNRWGIFLVRLFEW